MICFVPAHTTHSYILQPLPLSAGCNAPDKKIYFAAGEEVCRASQIWRVGFTLSLAQWKMSVITSFALVDAYNIYVTNHNDFDYLVLLIISYSGSSTEQSVIGVRTEVKGHLSHSFLLFLSINHILTPLCQ